MPKLSETTRKILEQAGSHCVISWQGHELVAASPKGETTDLEAVAMSLVQLGAYLKACCEQAKSPLEAFIVFAESREHVLDLNYNMGVSPEDAAAEGEAMIRRNLKGVMRERSEI